MKTVLAYHFTGDTLRDGWPIPKIGEWLVHSGPLVPCESGLHASAHPMDALSYAPGNMLHRVELGGEIVEHGGDKLLARRRRILATIDAEQLLLGFARWNAKQVLHLWNAPAVVKQWIETGDKSISAPASASASAAARSATWDAAWYAAWHAARDAARRELLGSVDKAFGIT